MSTEDPIFNLARLRILRLSAELEVELSGKDYAGPTIEILQRLQARAAESLQALVFCNLLTEKGRDEALTLQNEVKRYDEWFVAIKAIINEGKVIDQQLKEDEHEDTLEILTQTEEGRAEAVALGLIEDHPKD